MYCDTSHDRGANVSNLAVKYMLQVEICQEKTIYLLKRTID